MTPREFLLPVGALLLGICVAGGAGGPVLATSPDDPSSDSSTVVEALVAEALRSNRSLRQEELELERARAALAQARGQYLPRLDVQARYSRAEGGRTIDFPVGDLLNPAYRTLNDLTQGASFPEVDNQEIRFLREREQETALQLRQPLFNPEIVYGARARRHQVDAQAAAVEAFRRELVRDVRVGYFQYRTAAARVDILEATRTLVRENRRVSERLRAAAKATPEAVYRAEVEVLAVRQRLDAARAGVDRARRYLNVLRNRPADAPIPASRISEEALTDRFLATVRGELGGRLPSADSGAALSWPAWPQRSRPPRHSAGPHRRRICRPSPSLSTPASRAPPTGSRGTSPSCSVRSSSAGPSSTGCRTGARWSGASWRPRRCGPAASRSPSSWT